MTRDDLAVLPAHAPGHPAAAGHPAAGHHHPAAAASGFPTKGIALWALREFAADYAADLEGLTTEQACRRVVAPLTEAAGPGGAPCSFVEWLAASHAYSDGNGHAVNEATIFVSHAWGNNFLDLVDALEDKMAPLCESQAGEARAPAGRGAARLSPAPTDSLPT